MITELLQYTSALRHNDITQYEYLPTQLGSQIKFIHAENCDIEQTDLIILGCGEMRGQVRNGSYSNGPDLVRDQLYKLHFWHQNLIIGDMGNIIEGATLNDTRAALRTVLTELHLLNKKVLLIGGSHDLTVQQYEVFKSMEQVIDFSIVDMLADIDDSSNLRYDNYLVEALTSSPNFVRNFNLIGFQSYYVNPNVIETFDKLRFDCIRLGKAREDIEQIEPLMRSSHIASVDINCVKYSDAPANKLGSPNGFHGDEICKITRFAGMSESMHSFGIYGYRPEEDEHHLTAKLISQMIWYYMDGLYVQKDESPLSDKSQFLEYHITFTDNDTTFYKSKKTNRWWMQLSKEKIIPCSYQDYRTACNNEIPERWLREMERSM
nr:arginase family protein [Chitinophagaceae bacterium]